MSATDTAPTDGASRFSVDARWSFAIFIARSISSLAFVVATSRALGSANFAPLAALSAATSIAAVFTTSGLAHASTMFASRSSNGAGRILAAALRGAAASVSVVLVGFFALAMVVDGITIRAALALFVADVVIGGAAELVSSALIGLRRFRSAAVVLIAFSIGRALASVAVVTSTGVDLDRATLFALLGGLVAVPVIVATARSVLAEDGPAMAPLELTRAGGVFVAGNVVARVNNDFDKIFLPARLGAISSVGTYAVGYRLVEYALLPLTALSAAAYPRMFKAGAEGTNDARGLARRLSGVYFSTAIALTIALWLARDWAEKLFGPTYGDLSTVITLLLGLPLLRSASNLLGEPLTGSGLHRWRVFAMGCAAAANIAVNVALIDSLGWRAAVLATYTSEFVQLTVLAFLVLKLGNQPDSARPEEAAIRTS
jgi:O-antigen/teichoic acid export membrane protein